MRLLFLAILFTINEAYAQEYRLDENLLIGCWDIVLEDSPSDEFLSFYSCQDNESASKSLSFELNPQGTGRFYERSTSHLFPGYVFRPIDGTWDFDQKSKTLTIKYPDDYERINIMGVKEDNAISMIALQFKIETLLPGIFTCQIESTVINTIR